MNKKSILIIILIIIFAGGLYYFFSVNNIDSSQDPEGVFGEVVEASIDDRSIIIQDDDGREFNVKLNNNVEILSLFNRPIDLSSVEKGSFINALGDFNKSNSIEASKINVVDTDSNFEITLHDKGKIFTYSPGSKFKVILDGSNYSLSDLSCSPSGVVNNITDGPGANPPYYAAEFEAVSVGECKLENKDFSVDINIEE